MFVLLGSATFIIQPFDVEIFSKLKEAWVSAVHDFTKDDLSCLVTKGTFSRMFKMAWDAITGSSEKAIRIASNAFRRSGIFPFDPEAVDYSLTRNEHKFPLTRRAVIKNLTSDGV